MDSVDNFGYSEAVLDMLERLRVNCVNLNTYHRQRYFYFKAYGKWFRIPIILLSIFAASAAVGLQSLEVDQKVISGLSCLISLIVAMLSAVELHLSITDKLEDSYKFSKKYYGLSTDIYRVLKLNPEERSERGPDYLGRIFTEYSQLVSQSEMMRHAMKNDVLTRIPTELIEWKRTPTLTPDGSIEDDIQQIFSSIPHSRSIMFGKGSPALKKQYMHPIITEQDVKVTEDDVESNLTDKM
jgi:hypothetical protein